MDDAEFEVLMNTGRYDDMVGALKRKGLVKRGLATRPAKGEKHDLKIEQVVKKIDAVHAEIVKAHLNAVRELLTEQGVRLPPRPLPPLIHALKAQFKALLAELGEAAERRG